MRLRWVIASCWTKYLWLKSNANNKLIISTASTKEMSWTVNTYSLSDDKGGLILLVHMYDLLSHDCIWFGFWLVWKSVCLDCIESIAEPQFFFSKCQFSKKKHYKLEHFCLRTVSAFAHTQFWEFTEGFI